MGYQMEKQRLEFYTKKFLYLGCIVDILAIYEESNKLEFKEDL